MVMLVIIVTGVATFLVSSLNSSGLQITRDLKTTKALLQAKDALIGRATTNNNYPGSLPCPDTDNDGREDPDTDNDGREDPDTDNDGREDIDCQQYIGRLPWITLGLPDLRDASGERLWYTLSRNVRPYAFGPSRNSDQVGTLNITDAASDLMAIVFAPSTVTTNQRRSENLATCPTTSDRQKETNCAANYLEGSNADPSSGGAPNLTYQSSNVSNVFNDSLMTISQDQLFQPLEKRVGGEIRNILNTYHESWGAYPFAAPFEDPSTSSYMGKLGTYNGMLPVGDNVQPTWLDIPIVSFSASGSHFDCELDSGRVNDSRWRCNDISISDGETITITGTLKNVGRGLWRPHHIDNICEVRVKNSAGDKVLATSVLNNVTLTGTLNSDGSAAIIFQAEGKSGDTTQLDRIELRDIRHYKNINAEECSLPEGNSPPSIPTWLFDDDDDGNDWHHVAHYFVSNEFAPGGDHTCITSPCLTVNGKADGSNKHALVIMTGRTLAGAHPSGSLGDYLEGENVSFLDGIFENNNRSTTFNDQTIIVDSMNITK